MTKPLFIHIRNMADKMGTRYLQQTLNLELGLHIRQRMPEILKDLENILKGLRSELKDSGYDGVNGRSDHHYYFLLCSSKKLVSLYSKPIKNRWRSVITINLSKSPSLDIG